MRLIRRHHYGDIEGFELGFSLVGRPMMSVHFYRIGSIIIDTGQSRMQREALQIVAERPLQTIALTHYHEDHSGNAAAMRAATGARVLGHPLTVQKLSVKNSISPYQHLMWGAAPAVELASLPERIEHDDGQLIPLHAPGHSEDLTVYHDAVRGVLFSGDLFLADRIKYFRKDECIHGQILSLRRVLELDFKQLLCAHRPLRAAGPAHIAAKLQFLEDFVGRVADLKAQGFSRRAIVHQMIPPGDRRIKLFSLGDVQFAHMVRSALGADREIGEPPL